MTESPSDDRPGPAAAPDDGRIPGAPLRVLKFGSSVLRTAADLPRVVGEIYRQRRAGMRMIVVVSALAGETDELFGLARLAAGGSNAEGAADLVSLGEEKTAALLRIACARIGLDAFILRPEELCIHTSGSRLDADPDFIHGPAFARLAAAHDLVIMPGFAGLDARGARTLLGRGGSDFTAIFVGGELGAECVRLYKDVDGVFDHDPAGELGPAMKYAEVSWADCLEVARPLLQPRAMHYARAKGVRLEVEAIGSDAPTLVGPTTRPPAPAVAAPRLRVALAGFGAVGQALLARLRSEPRFNLVSVLVRDAQKPRGANPPALLTNSVEQFLDAQADILVEATPDPGAALDLCRHYLAHGRHVVTANERLAAAHLPELRAAMTGNARLLCSATVGGSAPVLETIDLARRHGPIREVQGVFNGTVNFLLERLRAGEPLAAALEAARRAGFAAANPHEDLSGRDVRAKLRIVAARSFGPIGRIDFDIEPLEIDRIAASGERWLQLATLTEEEGRVTAKARFVRAWLAPGIPPLAGERNHVSVRIEDGRTWTASGRGAGGPPAAEAVVADLYELARGDTAAARP